MSTTGPLVVANYSGEAGRGGGGGDGDPIPDGWASLDDAAFVGDVTADTGFLYKNGRVVTRCLNSTAGTIRVPAELAAAAGKVNSFAVQLEGAPVRVAPTSDVADVTRTYAQAVNQTAFAEHGTDLDLTVSGADLAIAGDNRLAVVDIVVYGFEEGTLDNLTVTATSSTGSFTPGTSVVTRHNPANRLVADSPWNGSPHRATAYVPLGDSASAQQLSIRVQGDQNVYAASIAVQVMDEAVQSAPFSSQIVVSKYAAAGFGGLASKSVPYIQPGTTAIRFVHGRRFALADTEPDPIVTYDPAPDESAVFYTASGIDPVNRFRDQSVAIATYDPDGDAVETSVHLNGGDAESRVVSTVVLIDAPSSSDFPFPEVTILPKADGSPRIAVVQVFENTVAVLS